MRGAVLVAVSATVGTFLQGWDAATMAGAIIYIKKELDLSTSVEGLLLALSLIGATTITTCSGSLSDLIGRKPMLVISSVLYFISGLVMLWSPNIYVLCIARLVDGFGVGLAVMLLPLYISETAPSEIRGMLNSLPQFTAAIGMFLSYCMTFGMSLTPSPSWRLMLGVLSIPSLVYLAITIFYLPESPRWLVSKGKMLEAKHVLQRLRGAGDVSGEMALLVEGLGVGGETSIEDYVIGPADRLANGEEPDVGKVMLHRPEEDSYLVAKPVTQENSVSAMSHQGSFAKSSMAMMDPLVTLFSSVHEKLPETGSMRSILFPNMGSMFGTTDLQVENEQSDVEGLQKEDRSYASDCTSDSDNDLHSPLILRHQASPSGVLSMRRPSTLVDETGQPIGSTDIGGGWQLAWKWMEKESEDGKKEGAFKRIYLHEEGLGSWHGSRASYAAGDIPAEAGYVEAAVLVSQPALKAEQLSVQHLAGPAMVHPSKTSKVPIWTALLEPGVKRALIVGAGLQILQQLSGISGVFAYTPQILEEAGVEVLLGNLGISSESASLLISAITTLLMIPSVGVGMWLMDIAGRRGLLLSTIPMLIVTLLVLVISQFVHLGAGINAAISTICVIAYTCLFCVAFASVPNTLCAEIFPTRVRGLCIAICAMVFWLGDIMVTYTLPVVLHSVGLTGLFAIFGAFCFVSWVFVFLKVPETKGMPLEVIIEFFAVGSRQSAS